ncbi:MAG TPA: rhomboid family intramembrane serine protease [Gemmatimonadaceae bacterium]|nr:rhomboid family intramembrane serine protease [Gemmatimonadaceae bacterium]
MLLSFGGVNAATIAKGEWWRLVTSQFVHVYPVHAVVNATAALLVGRQLERRHGAWTFVGVYLCAGIAGQATAILTSAELVATGASQAVMGISAALIILASYRLSNETAPAFGFIALSIALDLVFAHTVKLPHLAGLVAGVAFGLLLSVSRQR